MEKVFLPKWTTKGDLMKIAYRGDQDKLRNVDVSLPIDWVREHNVNTFWYVMDYNDSIFGDIVNLEQVALQNGIALVIE
jgi:hypothetical protein